MCYNYLINQKGEKDMERELKIKNCYLYLKMKDNETKEEATNRLENSLENAGIEYMYEPEDIEIQNI